jgi:hypothetical protein
MSRIHGENVASARRKNHAAAMAVATSRRAVSVRALLGVRGETASEPCRAAESNNLPNARQGPTPSAVAKPENGVRRLQRQGRDVRALEQVGRRGEAAGLDANGQQREPVIAPTDA